MIELTPEQRTYLEFCFAKATLLLDVGLSFEEWFDGHLNIIRSRYGRDDVNTLLNYMAITYDIDEPRPTGNIVH